MIQLNYLLFLVCICYGSFTTVQRAFGWIRPGIDECDWIGVTCDYNINSNDGDGDDYGYVTQLVLLEREAVGKYQ